MSDQQSPGTPPPPSSASAWESPIIETGPAPGVAFAPHGARLVAYIIDAIIVGIVTTVLIIVGVVAMGAGLRIDPGTGRVTAASISGLNWLILAFTWILAFLIGLLYFPWFWARGGRTLGMRPFGLRVVRDRDGGRIGWGTALLRLVGMWVSGAVFYIGFIWIFVDNRRRGWHDLIAGTVMIKDH